MDSKLSSEHQSIIDEELAIHERVKQAVRKAALLKREQLRDGSPSTLNQLRDLAAEASNRDLPNVLDTLHSSQAISRRLTQQKLPDMRAPYFAHIRIRDKEKGKDRNLFLGNDSFFDLSNDVQIIDWRTAPLSKVFFNFKEGEPFEVELPNRVANGDLLVRRVLQFKMGQLIEIQTPHFSLRLVESRWIFEDRSKNQNKFAGGEAKAMRSLGTGATGRSTPEIAALLDAEQYRILQSDPSHSLLILGAAGSGKTTVALYRVSYLFNIDPEFYAQHRLLVIVPEPGLVRLCRKLLDGMKMERVVVATYDDWIYNQAKYVIPSIARRVYQSTPPRIMRFKRHQNISIVFPELARIKAERIYRHMVKEYPYFEQPLKTMFNKGKETELKSGALLKRLEAVAESCKKFAAEEVDTKKKKSLEKAALDVAKVIKEQLYGLESDRIELFTNQDLLTRIVQSDPTLLDLKMVKELMYHTQAQLTPPEEPVSQADLDPEFSRAVDNRYAVDNVEEDDDYDEIYRSVDPEDFSVMFELLHYYTDAFDGLKGRMHSYSHLVLDEAQEVGPLELRLLGHALGNEGSVSVAGDAVQQTDPHSLFRDWESSLQALGAKNVKFEHLNTSYRCPKSIMDFAYAVLGKQGEQQNLHIKLEHLRTLKGGAPVILDAASDEGHVVSLLLEELESLRKTEPAASVAIICADLVSAKSFYAALKGINELRFVRDGDFSFTPGIDVTDASQVKGLEFDYVIIPDCDIYKYPDTPEARRTLHVAVTRAIHQLWVLAPKLPSPTIKSLLS